MKMKVNEKGVKSRSRTINLNKGEMSLFVSCTPAWDPAQHISV